jgi:hypothetical protein
MLIVAGVVLNNRKNLKKQLQKLRGELTLNP